MQAGENVAGVNVGNAHVVCCSVRMRAAAGPSLGSELAGMMRRSSSSFVGFVAGCQ